ncbi:helix-turn-helix domain-containing protein [Leptolyngbya sp. AN03gr2]|uniref:helix-turn-helix domain-containing protein n=1 Tax=unclassified Leptolyngbya TaxID=2650499 RepID=UPI003D311030
MMPDENPIDLQESESSLKLFPRSPVQLAVWQDIFLVHHRQPAWEMPENHLVQHILSINIGADRKIERVIDGQFQQEQFLSGNVAIYPAEVNYSLRWEKESEFLLLGIAPNWLSQIAIELSVPETVELMPLLSIHDPLIQNLALTLKAELDSPQMGGKLLVESIGQTLAIHLLRNYSSHRTQELPTYHGLPKYKLQQAIDYIHDFLDRELSLADLGAVVQMSPFHFAHLFKESTGLAPHQFVIRCRVERAKELLLQSSLSIADIAAEVGFANQSHLTRHFKRIVGLTPREALQKANVDRKNVQNPAKT